MATEMINDLAQLSQNLELFSEAIEKGEVKVTESESEDERVEQQYATHWKQLQLKMKTKSELQKTGIETLCNELLARGFKYKEDVELAMREIYEAYGGIPVLQKNTDTSLIMVAKNTWTSKKRMGLNVDPISHEVPDLLLRIRATFKSDMGHWKVVQIKHPSAIVEDMPIMNQFGGLNLLANTKTEKSIPVLQRMSESPIHAYTSAILARLIVQNQEGESDQEKIVTLKRSSSTRIKSTIKEYITSTETDGGLPLSVSHIKVAALKLLGEDTVVNAASMPTLATVLESRGHGVKHSIGDAAAMEIIAKMVRDNENKYIVEYNKGKNLEEHLPLRSSNDMPTIPSTFQFTTEFFVAPHYWKDLGDELFNHSCYGLGEGSGGGNGLIPVIILDAAHLSQGGIIYTLSSLNSNRNIALLAFGYCVNNECESTWTSFLNFCKEHYPSMNRSTITALLDSDKGGWNALGNCLPNLQGFRCHHHLQKNMTSRLGGYTTKEFFKLALDTKPGLATRIMDFLKSLAPKRRAVEYVLNLLSGESSKAVILSYSSRVGDTSDLRAWRGGIVASSAAESVNAALRKKGIRSLSALNIILGTLEWSTDMYLKGRQEAWEEGSNDKQTAYVEKESKKFGTSYASNASVQRWIATKATEDNPGISKVTCSQNETYVVDLKTMQCQCNRPIMFGLPCFHVYKAVVHNKGEGFPFTSMLCHTNYTMGQWRSQYPKSIKVAKVPSIFEIRIISTKREFGGEHVLQPPLFYPIKRGRPKKNQRYRSFLEKRRNARGNTDETEGTIRLLPMGGASIGVDIEDEPPLTHRQLQQVVPTAFGEGGNLMRTRKCRLCKAAGHNARTCPGPAAPTTASAVTTSSSSESTRSSIATSPSTPGAGRSVEQGTSSSAPWPKSTSVRVTLPENSSGSEFSASDMVPLAQLYHSVTARQQAPTFPRSNTDNSLLLNARSLEKVAELDAHEQRTTLRRSKRKREGPRQRREV